MDKSKKLTTKTNIAKKVLTTSFNRRFKKVDNLIFKLEKTVTKQGSIIERQEKFIEKQEENIKRLETLLNKFAQTSTEKVEFTGEKEQEAVDNNESINRIIPEANNKSKGNKGNKILPFCL